LNKEKDKNEIVWSQRIDKIVHLLD